MAGKENLSSSAGSPVPENSQQPGHAPAAAKKVEVAPAKNAETAAAPATTGTATASAATATATSATATTATVTASASAAAKAASAEMFEDPEAAEVPLFQIKECYVYKIPPRMSAASHRADDWNINKWAWEGALRVISKGDTCVIRLEDARTGELFAQAPIRPDQPVPVEPVIDSSRFFVMRIEDNSATSPAGKGGDSAKKGVPVASTKGGSDSAAASAPGPSRHAFIGIGFRERPSAYDFQAAVYDHVKYLNKKKEAEEMEQEFQSRPAADYSLKEGQTIKLEIKRPSKTGSGGLSRLKLSDRILSPSTPGGVPPLLPVGFLPAVPPPSASALAAPSEAAPGTLMRQTSGDQSSKENSTPQLMPSASGSLKNAADGEDKSKEKSESEEKVQNGGVHSDASEKVGPVDEEEEDFGDFQAA